jgi:Spy/CpxP family protein refolding chaperone
MNTPDFRSARLVSAMVTAVLLHLPVLAQQPPNPAPGGPTPAERPGRRPPDGAPGARGGFGGGGFRFDDQQRDLIRQASQKESAELRRLNDKLQAAQKEFVQAVVAEKYDEKAVREKADAAARVQADIAVVRSRIFATIAPTLTPEQRQQLENSQITMGIIMSGGGGGRVFPAPGGPRGGGDGEPGDRNLRRREPGNPGAPEAPRRRPPGQEQ